MSKELVAGLAAAKQEQVKELVAADLLNSKHPLHGAFAKWLEQKNGKLAADIKPSRRQARKFLSQFPRYRDRVAVAA